MKKLLSTLLAVLLAVTMLTGMAIPAQAAENDIFNPGVLELDGSRTFTISKTKSSAFFSFTPETTGCYEFRIQNKKLKDVDVDFGIMDNYVMTLTFCRRGRCGALQRCFRYACDCKYLTSR